MNDYRNDYISRQECKEAFNYAVKEVGVLDNDDIIEVLKLIPSANVRENVKGEWFGDRSCDSVFECNMCGLAWQLNDGTPEENQMNFCPKCGANMRNIQNE